MMNFIDFTSDETPKMNMNETLPSLLIKFAQRENLKYETVLTQANRIIQGGWNEFTGYGVTCSGGNSSEREESLRKSLYDKYAN